MTSILTAVVAILGTLAGSLATYLLQKRMSLRAEQFERSERLRQDRLMAYGEFARSIMDYRRAEYARWEATREPSAGEVPQEARALAHQMRTTAWHAFFTVQLLADDQGLIDAAGNLLEITSDIHHASDESDLQHRGSLVRADLADFVAVASAQLR